MVKTVPITLLLIAAALPAQAQEAPERFLLEAGLVGGNSITCPGHYIGVEGRVAGPLSIYGMIEPYQCTDVPEVSSRLGTSVRFGPARWLIRPALRTGLEYADTGDVSYTLGGSVTFGRRYGARLVVDRWKLPGGEALVLVQIGGYFSF